MEYKNISVLPQDLPLKYATEIRKADPKAKIYPASVVLSESSKHFTKDEYDYIIKRQNKLFGIESKECRVFVIISNTLTQDRISSLLYN